MTEFGSMKMRRQRVGSPSVSRVGALWMNDVTSHEPFKGAVDVRPAMAGRIAASDDTTTLPTATVLIAQRGIRPTCRWMNEPSAGGAVRFVRKKALRRGRSYSASTAADTTIIVE